MTMGHTTSMDTLHCQALDSIAHTQSQFPLFLHIFQKAEQLNHRVQATQLQNLRDELSATGNREGLYSNSTNASTNLRKNFTENCVDSAFSPSPLSDLDNGCSPFNTEGFYLHRDAPFNPFFDDGFGGEFKCRNTTGNALATTGTDDALDEPGCSLSEARNGRAVSMEGFSDDVLNGTPRMEAKEVTLHDNFCAHNLDAAPSAVVSMYEFTSDEGTSHSILDTSLAEVNDFDAFPTDEVTDATIHCSTMVEYAGGPDVFTPELATDGYKTSKLAPDKLTKEDYDHDVSFTDGICDDDANRMIGDGAGVTASTTPDDCTVDLQDAEFFTNIMHTVGAHGQTPARAEHAVSSGASRAEVHDTFSNGDVKSSSYTQKWLRHLRGVSDSWQDLWQLGEETSYGHSAPSYSDSDYVVVSSAVLDIAKCLPKNETLQEHLQPFSGRINHHCGNAILYKLRKEQLFLPALSFFDWMRLHNPCLLTSRSLCTMFTILGEASMIDRAVVLYHNLKHCKELWVVQVFNALLSALSKHYRYDEALAVFKDMSSMKIQPDSVTFCILLNLACRSGSSVKALWKIFVYMEKKKVFAGHEVFGILIKALCQEGLRDEALKLLSVMEGRRLIPNIVIYNTLIGAFTKSGMLEEAEGLVSEMKGKGICVTLVTYNLLIDGYASARNFEVAEGILQGMLDKGPQPSVHSFTALIAAYGKNFQSEKAASVFLRMKKNGVSPNTIAYTALIHAYAEDGWQKKAEYAFENMIREGFVPTVETYTSLLHAFRQAGDLEKVKSVWKRMRSERIIGTRATFNVIMDAYAKQGEYAEARNVMNEFNKAGCKPDRKTYNMLINAYTRGGQHSKAPELLEEMHNAGFSPDSYTFTSLIFSFLRVRDFTQAFKYHDRMCRDNQFPDKYTYQKLQNLLDDKYEVKLERNMNAAIGAQRAEHLGDEEKRPKSFRKRKKMFRQTNTLYR